MLDGSGTDQLLTRLGFMGNPFGLREVERASREDVAAAFFEHPLFPQVLG